MAGSWGRPSCWTRTSEGGGDKGRRSSEPARLKCWIRCAQASGYAILPFWRWDERIKLGEKLCLRKSARRSFGSRWRIDLGVMIALFVALRRGVAGGVDGEVAEMLVDAAGPEETSK